jgi:hypothetical protein
MPKNSARIFTPLGWAVLYIISIPAMLAAIATVDVLYVWMAGHA